MKPKQILLALVLIDFTAFTGYVLYEHGLGWIEVVLSNTVSTLVFVDLCIALAMVMVWMVGDAREKGITVWPYIAATLFAGSVGTLAYLIRRDWAPGREQRPRRSAGGAVGSGSFIV